MGRRVVIVGDSAFAEIAKEYFDRDSEYEVAGFAVEKEYLDREEFKGLSVVAFENVEEHFAPETHDVFVAIAYGNLNRLRTRLVAESRSKGYMLASYVSSDAFVGSGVRLGEHCFIFEHNTVQPFVTIGDNVVLWSGNHIGHHSSIGNNCFIASHVVVSGYCNLGENSFFGVNSTIGDGVSIGSDNWVGPGIVITRNTDPGALFGAPEPEASRVSTYRFFRIKE